MQEGVHIGRGDIVLLVPGSGGEHHIREQSRGGHTEIRGDQQIQLALRGILVPLDLTRNGFLVVGTLHVVHAAHKVLEEVALTLSGGAEQVRAPQHQGTRPVHGVVHVFNRELQITGVQTLSQVVGVVLRLTPCHCLFSFISQVEGVLGELRVERHPAHTDRAGHHVCGVYVLQLALTEGGLQVVGGVTVLTELVGVHVPEAGTDHMTRRAAPVQSVRHIGQTGERTRLLLTHIVGPAAAVTALAPGQVQQSQNSAVGGICVVPLANTSAEDDHGTTVRVDSVLRKLACHADYGLRRNRSNLLLPCRGVLDRPVVVARGPFTGQPGAPNTVGSEHQVEDGGDFLALDVADGHTTGNNVAVALGVVEGGKFNLDCCSLTLGQIADRQNGFAAIQFKVPVTLIGLRVTMPHGAVGNENLTGFAVHHGGLEGGVLLVLLPRQRRSGQELGGHLGTVFTSFEGNQERKIRVGQREVLKELHALIHVVFLKNDVTHRHSQRRVGACLCGQPFISELGVVGVVGANRDNLGAAVTHLGDPVGIRGTGHGNVRTPHDQVGSIPPVTGFGHVGLIAKDLRGGHGKVGVPVVEAGHHAANKLDETHASAEGDHRHCRNRGEAGAAVGPVVLNGVHMSGRNKFECFSPGGAHQAAFTACTNVAVAFNRVGDDGVECFHRVAVKRLRLTVHFEQQTAHIGVFHAGRRVRVPREGCATGAPAGLIFGTIGTDCGIVSFLRFPGDNAVFDIHLPRAGTGAVHPVG